MLGFAGQFLGFDSVVVGTTDDLALVSSDVDPALRLTVSKRLGNRFELVLSDNLDDNELTWVIIYRPRPGFEFRAISRGGSEFTGEFRQEIPFGPGVSPPRIASRRKVARDRIVGVTVSGEPGLAEADVLSATSLKAGDHFDFGRWVDDRERITRLYLDRGYFSARIVPTRRAIQNTGAEPRVALDYRITRGPRTVLTVSGYDPPQALLDQLRQTWSDSVLVDLLGADLEQVVRDHLAGLGYLRATVKATVDSDDRRSTDRVGAGRARPCHDRAPSGVLGQHGAEREGVAGPRTARPIWTPRRGRTPRRCWRRWSPPTRPVATSARRPPPRPSRSPATPRRCRFRSSRGPSRGSPRSPSQG